MARDRRAPVLTLVLAGILMLWWRNRGFDGTDEAYYLAWAVDPARYDVSIHPAGLFWHVAVWRATRSVAALRLAGFGLLVMSGWAFGTALTRYYAALGIEIASRAVAPLSAALATSFYIHGIATPGYNLLALAGALVMGAGWFAVAAQQSERGRAGPALLLGVGVCLAFLGKPPSAALGGAVIAGWLLLEGRRRPVERLRTAGLVGLGCLVPLTTVLFASVSVTGFVESVVRGRAVLDFDNSLPRLLTRVLRDVAEAPLYLAAPAVALALAIAGARDGGVGRNGKRAIAAVLALALLAWPYSAARWVAMGATPAMALGPGALAAATGFAALGIARSGQTRAAVLTPLVVLLLAPLLVGFGTANDWWLQVGMAMPFVAMAGVLTTRLFFARAVPLADAAACVATVLMLTWAVHAPYRLSTGLVGQNVAIRLPMSTERWFVDPATARLASALGSISPKNATTPLIDLANQGPGIAALLGARAPFFPWLNANFGNARRLADAAWASMKPAEQAHAWFVVPVVPTLADAAPARYLRENAARYMVVARVRQPLSGAPLAIVRPR